MADFSTWVYRALMNAEAVSTVKAVSASLSLSLELDSSEKRHQS